MSEKNPEASEEGTNQESPEERSLRFRRNCRHFIGYINFNWDTDLEWQDFKKVNMKGLDNPKQIEEVKREYYKMNINDRLDTSFVMQTQEERDEFLDMCKYIASILSLS